MTEPRHGSAADRGSADAYYGRPKKPHYYTGATYQSERVEPPRMTPSEVTMYLTAYDSERDRKNWGAPVMVLDDDME